MNKDKTMMRVDKNLLKELLALKKFRRETYGDVIKRMIDKERKKKI